ncbi:MAG: response regulator [Acidobacteria bacterium]|nr:response regulator [Acidobacteriota bacterium]
MKPKREKGPTKQRTGGPGRRPIVGITDPQKRTLEEIRDYIARKGYPPTIQELAGILGITHASTHAQVNQLVRKGYLRREARKARGLVVVREPVEEIADLVRIPLLGRVAAGRPLLAEENIIGEVLVEGRVASRGRCFALEVILKMDELFIKSRMVLVGITPAFGPHVQMGSEQTSLGHQPTTILLVENEEDILSLLRESLKEGGMYTVLEARDAAEALAVARNRPAEIDLVLADVSLPKMSGFELVKKLRAFDPDKKVLFLTTQADESAIPKPTMSFLTKPFDAEAFAAKVRKLLSTKASGHEHS